MTGWRAQKAGEGGAAAGAAADGCWPTAEEGGQGRQAEKIVTQNVTCTAQQWKFAGSECPDASPACTPEAAAQLLPLTGPPSMLAHRRCGHLESRPVVNAWVGQPQTSHLLLDKLQWRVVGQGWVETISSTIVLCHIA
jgi:hypothetical protein